MKKATLFLIIIGFSSQLFAQQDFNKWSLDAGLGFNKAMGPLSPEFLTPTLNFGHYEFGARYMINEYWGFRGNLGFGNFESINGRTPSFQTGYTNVSLVAVSNIGRILKFESFSDKLTLLGDFGIGTTRMKYKTTTLNFTKPEYVYTFKSGFTGLFKISEKVALTGRIEVNMNGRQTYTLDGNRYNAPEPTNFPNPPFVHATGVWWASSIGLNFYIGSKDQHADWYVKPDPYATKEELASQISGIKDMLKDSDGDGVPDYLDKEPNTPSDARVGTNGVTLDSDGDGIADHLDKCPFLPGPAATSGCPVEEIVDQVDYLRKAIQDNYVNVYFGFDSSKPLGYSISSVQFVSNFLKRNPGIKLEVKGYADEIGPENYNMKLSEKRAKAVFELLIQSGIDASRLTYKGYGEDTSVNKSSENARQMARRTSFEIK